MRFDPAIPQEPEETVPSRTEKGPRRMKISGKLLKKYGYTAGCDGCRYKEAGMEEQRAHSEACRDRIWEALEKDDEGLEEKARQHERMQRQSGEEAGSSASRRAPGTEGQRTNPNTQTQQQPK